MMEAARTAETSVYYNETTRRSMPEGYPLRSWGDWLVSEEWIYFAQDRDQWRDILNTVMNLRALAPRSLLVIWLVRKSDMPLATV
jgi:hypothetical protein